ncbi:MAG: S8 family serine peptidase, partial [Chthoniobacteraceae bacterium]
MSSLPLNSCARFCLALVVVSAVAGAAEDLPANLGSGLRQLVAWHVANARNLPPERRAAAVQEQVQAESRHMQADAAGRVVVDVYLDGRAPEADVRAALAALGVEVFASLTAGTSTAAKHGVMSAYLPVERAVAAAKLPGVQSVMLVHRPWRRVGAKTSQGLPPMKVNAVQRRKFTGAGITVGVLSDSYDVTFPTAAMNVQRGDLPGIGNRAKHLMPVRILGEGDPADFYNIDEGRAMLQIIHDVAPDSALVFCGVGATQATFAESIRRLRTEGNCDVLVDDIGFPDEPFFSDGIVAQAVEDVVNSDTLGGKKVLFYSAAGNNGAFGYEADFAAVSDADARAAAVSGNSPRLSQVPTELTGGGFHNFAAGPGTDIVQKCVISGLYAELNFQWNDLFNAAAMTSDFNVLVFDGFGNYRGDVSGVDDSFATGQARELVSLEANPDSSERVYQIVIARRSGGTGAAQHFRYLIDAEGNVGGTYFNMKLPAIFGHSGARSADGIGAYAYNRLARPEEFTSFGPVSIYFDDAGNRLATPEVRLQPTVSGPDGVATSMVRFNPFFGTSAAAPHVAAAAALILQAAGGPGSLDAAQVRQTLQATARPHDLEPLTATASSTTNGTVTLTGFGDVSRVSSESENFFTLEFAGPAGAQLKSILIDLTPAGLKFDTSADLGFPFTVGSTSGGVAAPVNGVVLPGLRKLLVTFGSFPPGGKVTFG